ncbi:MAG: efflux RND transporter periplasmic adaptor subunit [Deltaproteobacteria bacterium]|nr:efflux RND transporter periplasmic adaptor subunit [Deltaproteobacteria bacterium]
MRRVALASVAALLVGLLLGWLIFHSSERPPPAGARKVLYYRNPMNPQVTSDHPMKDPMGMDYVPVYADEPAAQGSEGGRVLFYRDPQRPWITSDAPGKVPGTDRELAPVREGDPDAKGVAINPTMVQNTGVRIEEVRRSALRRVVRTVGTVSYDERKLASINLKFAGWIDRLYVNFTGQAVRRGQPLLDVYSPELVSTQQEYLLALRFKTSLGAASQEATRAQADALLESARRRLRYWDVPDSEIRALERRGRPKKALTLRSPANGVVLERAAVEGAQVQPGMPLFEIADLSDVWVYAQVYPQDLAWISIGDEAQVALSYLPGRTFRGRVSFIQPVVDVDARTVRVRIQVAQPSRSLLLRPDMYANVELRSRETVEGVAIPEQAVLRTGERTVVIVALGRGFFQPREVRLGVAADGRVEILEGLRPGEKLVTSSQFLIDSESNLRAALSSMSEPSMPGMGHGAHGPPAVGGSGGTGADAGMGEMPGMQHGHPH